jgi:multisubunit Na+/H+ antiporter MnhC subunit
MSLFLDGVSLLFWMTGLYGLFSQTHLLKKIGAWFVFQLGFLFFLFSLTEGGHNPLPAALGLDLLIVTLALVGFLLLLARLIRKEKKSLDERILARKEEWR